MRPFSVAFILSFLLLTVSSLDATEEKRDISEITNERGLANGANNAGNDDQQYDNPIGVTKISEEDNNPSTAYSGVRSNAGEGEEKSEEGYTVNTFLMSVSMIVVSEIGDKTFLIAALMSMRNSRAIVFAGAFSSLVIMTFLSGIVGHALPTLLSRRLTQLMASVLFVIFGIKLLKEGLEMPKSLGVEDEIAEVEEEIASSTLNQELDVVERGDGSTNLNTEMPSSNNIPSKMSDELKNLASFVLTPIFIQAFIMTFLGEWGDRSQIATIAMAAGSDYWVVILGAIVGHGFCTAAACIGGKILASRISMRNVTLGGSIAFFVFAILYFYSAYYDLE